MDINGIYRSPRATCPGTWKAELEAYFEQFGELEDVYLPGKAAKHFACFKPGSLKAWNVRLEGVHTLPMRCMLCAFISACCFWRSGSFHCDRWCMFVFFFHDGTVLSWRLKGTHGWFMQSQDSRLMVNTRRRSIWSSLFTGILTDTCLLNSFYISSWPSGPNLCRFEKFWTYCNTLAGSQEHRLCPVQGSILVRLLGIQWPQQCRCE